MLKHLFPDCVGGSDEGFILKCELVDELGLVARLRRPTNLGILLLPRFDIPVYFVKRPSGDRDILHEVLEDGSTTREVSSRSETNLGHIPWNTGCPRKT